MCIKFLILISLVYKILFLFVLFNVLLVDGKIAGSATSGWLLGPVRIYKLPNKFIVFIYFSWFLFSIRFVLLISFLSDESSPRRLNGFIYIF